MDSTNTKMDAFAKLLNFPHCSLFDEEDTEEMVRQNKAALVEEANNDLLEIITLTGLYEHYETKCLKHPIRTSIRNGNKYIMEIMKSHTNRCYQDLRLYKDVYLKLCDDLTKYYGLTPSRWLSVHESIAIFLMTLGYNAGNRLLQSIFNHSGETIHQHFHKVLQAVTKMAHDIIRTEYNYNEVVHPKLMAHPRHYSLFKDCIGAIDGTHVKVIVPEDKSTKYRGRKGITTQNILACCDFDMCFTFVWAGWEGSAHDSRIFANALRRDDLRFPHPRGDKHYVLDARYSNKKGYLTAYTGSNIRYHLPDFRRGSTRVAREPKGRKEKFYYLHSSIRNIIERTFGVWKARFSILHDIHKGFSYKDQVYIVCASMAIHNYIRKNSSTDNAFKVAEQESYDPSRDVNIMVGGVDEGCTSSRTSCDKPSCSDGSYMDKFRDFLAE